MLPAMGIKEENVLGKWIVNAKDLTWKNFGLTRKPNEASVAGFQHVRGRKKRDDNL